jgi:hypothetical protein
LAFLGQNSKSAGFESQSRLSRSWFHDEPSENQITALHSENSEHGTGCPSISILWVEGGSSSMCPCREAYISC